MTNKLFDEFTTDELKEWLADELGDTLDDDATNSMQDEELIYDIMQEIYCREDISQLEFHAIEFWWQVIKPANATSDEIPKLAPAFCTGNNRYSCECDYCK